MPRIYLIWFYFFHFNLTLNRKKNSSIVPVNLATPLNVISSIIVGSERPLAFAANNIILYKPPGSKLSIGNSTGGR